MSAAPRISKFLSPAEIEANRFVVLATFRHLLRATGLAFKDDVDTLKASRQFAKAEFLARREQQPGSMEAGQGIEHAQGVTKILREHVVQGTHQGDGKYKLNIHEHTQRLDNDTAGQLKGTTKSFREVKDAVF